MTRRYRSGHLETFVDAYVDGQLDAASSERAARHLIACVACRRAVDAERAIVVQVRRVPLDPGRHARLVAGLVALEGSAPQSRAVDEREGFSSPVPVSPQRVHVVAPDAPAQYSRSSRRSVLGVAALAAACGAIVVSNAAQPRSTAPARPTVASTVHGDDTIQAPEVRGESAQTLAQPRWSTFLIQASNDRSGRMSP